MKRILALTLSAALLLALLGGCSDPGAQGSADPSNNPTQTVEPTPEPVPADLTAFFGALYEAYHFPGMDQISGNPDMQEYLDNWYAGISDISTEQLVICTPAMSAVATEIALVQVTNASDVNAVKDILQARIDYQVGDPNDETKPGGAYYPAVIEGWKNNSRIVSNGSYVMMIVHEHCDDIVADFNAIIADPTYVPTPNSDTDPEGGDSEGGDSEGGDSQPGGGLPGGLPGGGIGGGSLVIPVPTPNGDTDPEGDNSESDGGSEGGGVTPGFGNVVVNPGVGGDTDPEGGDSEGGESDGGGTPGLGGPIVF